MGTTSHQPLSWISSEAKAPQRVLIDARKWRDGGIGTYTRSLIRAALTRHDITLGVLIRTQDHFAFRAEFERDLKKIKLEFCEAAGYSLAEYFNLPRKIDWKQYDLYHSPHYTLPFGIPVKKVITIHDLIHITNPQAVYYPWVAKALIASSLKRADQVLSVSNSSAADVREYFPALTKQKPVQVLPNALEHDFVNQACDSELPLAQLVNGEYWLVVVSGHKPHKGVLDLLRAFAVLREQVRSGKITNGKARRLQSLRLVVVGPGSEQIVSDPQAMALVTNLENVQLQGKVSKSDLLKLYAHAAAVIVPSLAEGFGLPVLEAHAFGRPVIMRPVKALVEQALTGDIVCHDFTERALSEAMLEFLRRADDLTDTQLMANEARRQALSFNYEQMGRQLSKCYAQALGGKNKQ